MKRIGFDRPTVKKIVEPGRVDIFNDQYQHAQNRLQILKEKYANTLAKDQGLAKSTIYGSAKKNTNEKEDRFSNIKLKDEIIKSTPDYTNLRKVPMIEKFYNNSK